MHAMFVADGHFATLVKRKRAAAAKRAAAVGGSILDTLGKQLPKPIRRLTRRFTVSDAATLDRRKEPQVIETFNNIELYGLIVNLLDLHKFAAPHNGTTGFWDQYLDESLDDEDDV